MFHGVGVALITPFKQDNSIDFTALGKIIDGVIYGGVDFLVALGTTAETPTLSKEEKVSVLNFILDHSDKRVPVVVGMGGNNTRELLDGLKDYPLERVAGILSVAPYYNKPSQEGIYQHFKALAQHTDKPIILYNVPGRTASNILPATAVRLAKDFKNIVAIKEASGNIPQCMELIKDAPDNFTVLSGDDNLFLAQAAIGMKGIISVVANSHPKDFCTMAHSALKNKMEEARSLHYKLLPLIHLAFLEGNPTGVKYACHLKGLCENKLRLPLVTASADLQQLFKALSI